MSYRFGNETVPIVGLSLISKYFGAFGDVSSHATGELNSPSFGLLEFNKANKC